MSATIDEVLLRRPAIDLATVRGAGDLQHRFDTKYVLVAETAAEVVALLDHDWHVLEVDNRRATEYRSSYFDDAEFSSFRDHIKGRRLRYKVRTRQYGSDPGEVLEIKLKSGRGATDKRRVQRTGHLGPKLTDSERNWLSDMVFDAYGKRTVDPLHYALGLQYKRRTLFNPATNERLTIDTGLVAEAGRESASPVGDAVVVEVKSVDWYGQTVRLLQQHSVRPLTFSKYCAALASLYPELDQRARQRAQRSFTHHLQQWERRNLS